MSSTFLSPSITSVVSSGGGAIHTMLPDIAFFVFIEQGIFLFLIAVWHGLICLHAGPFRGGLFRFNVFFPDRYVNFAHTHAHTQMHTQCSMRIITVHFSMSHESYAK